MPKVTSSVPKYRKHSSSAAHVNGRVFLLGPYGTKASKIEYDRIIAEYLVSGRRASCGFPNESLTIVSVMADYLDHAKAYYGTASEQSGTSRVAYASDRPPS
jgi:hypothetical protein